MTGSKNFLLVNCKNQEYSTPFDVKIEQCRKLLVKFIYSEKATKFCEIFNSLLTTVHTVKRKVKILQYFVAFSEYMNFNGNPIDALLRILPQIGVRIEIAVSRSEPS